MNLMSRCMMLGKGNAIRLVIDDPGYHPGCCAYIDTVLGQRLDASTREPIIVIARVHSEDRG
jgi:hypothetical protein